MPAVEAAPATVVASPATMVASPYAVTIEARTPPIPVIPWAVAVIIAWRWGNNYRRYHRNRRGRYRHWRRRYYDRRRGDGHSRERHPYADAHIEASLSDHNGPD
jgi:hypothetical protein